MKKTIILISTLLLFIGSVGASEGFIGRPNTDNLFMPTGYTINKGEFLLGIGPISYGLSNNIQVGTNIFLFLFQDYNANVKISFIKSAAMSFAAGVHLHDFNLEVFGADSNFTSVSPFASFTTRLGRNTAVHIGGQYSFFSGEEEIENAVAGTTSSGSSFYLGIEQSISHKTKFLAETGYDFTFEGFRLGGAVLFGWKTFRLKLGINYFNPDNSGGYIMPVISLWWRFNG